MPLFLVLGYLLTKGFASLNWAFFTAMPAPVGEKGGGMANAIVGTFEVVGLACLIGVPIGVGAGLYLAANRASRFTNSVRFSADVLMGMPSIVVGIFAYAVVVRPIGGFSTLAGAVALAIIMIPLVTRTTEEMVLLVPHELREASLALGVPRWRTTLSVVARTAMSGITTGVILAIARVAGETAPLLFTAFGNRFWSTSLFHPIAIADRAGLHLCHFAVCRLAASGVGGRAGADGDRSRPGTGRAMGDGRGGESAEVVMADKLVVKNLTAYFGQESRAQGRQPDVRGKPYHGDHRSVGMRQIDPGAMPQPDARGGARRHARRRGDCSTAKTSTAPASIRCRCGAESGWCFRSRRRFRPCRSRTTSRPV